MSGGGRPGRSGTVGPFAVVLVVALAIAGCAPADARPTTLTVFAAGSLTAPFTALETRFEATHDDVDVQLNYAGSSRLAQQIGEGAPVDVFASADEANLAKVADLVEGEPRIFATNTMTIAVQRGNPLGVTGLADLSRPDVVLVRCVPQAPCGAATAEVQRFAGVTLRPASEEPGVKGVLNKLEAGEADAGLVYVTDVRGRDLTEVPIPEAKRVVNRYPVATLADADEPELARAFADLVTGDVGQRVLRGAGFGAP